MKVRKLTVTSVVTNMRKAERNVLLGEIRDNCKGRNHFKSKCKKVHAVSQFQNGNEDFDDQWLMAVNYKEESTNASSTCRQFST